MVPRKIFSFFSFLASLRDRWCADTHETGGRRVGGERCRCKKLDSAHPSKRPLMGIITCYGGSAERGGEKKNHASAVLGGSVEYVRK